MESAYHWLFLTALCVLAPCLLLGRDIYILQQRQPQLVAAPGRHLQETQVILTG